MLSWRSLEQIDERVCPPKPPTLEDQPIVTAKNGCLDRPECPEALETGRFDGSFRFERLDLLHLERLFISGATAQAILDHPQKLLAPVLHLRDREPMLPGPLRPRNGA